MEQENRKRGHGSGSQSDDHPPPSKRSTGSSEASERLYADLRRYASKLPPGSRQEVEKRIKDLESTPPAKSIDILMTGKTGTGKSTLINGILGLKAAKVGQSIKGACTTAVTKYQESKDGIDMTIWDSPGLQDGEKNQVEYLDLMQRNCSKVHLTMYCIKTTETRFVRGDDNPDVVAMKKFTIAFGRNFWKHAIIVLTFANMLEAQHDEWEDLSDNEKAKAFQAVIQEWVEQIKKILILDIKLPKEIVDRIAIIPAGKNKLHLPGTDYWLSNLWLHCLSTVRNNETELALLKINRDRFKEEFELTKDDYKKPPEQQPIIIREPPQIIYRDREPQIVYRDRPSSSCIVL